MNGIWNSITEVTTSVSNFINSLPDTLQKAYESTKKFLAHSIAIAKLGKDMLVGNWDGIEEFIEHTLPELTEDPQQAAEWKRSIKSLTRHPPRTNSFEWYSGQHILSVFNIKQPILWNKTKLSVI